MDELERQKRCVPVAVATLDLFSEKTLAEG